MFKSDLKLLILRTVELCTVKALKDGHGRRILKNEKSSNLGNVVRCFHKNIYNWI